MSAGNDHIEIIRYLKGEMSHEEAHAFEKRALDDPFLADALEGAESIGVDQFEKDLKNLESKLHKRKASSFSFLKIAAVVSLLILGGFSIWYITDDLKTSDVVYNDPESDDQESTQDSPETSAEVEEPKQEAEKSHTASLPVEVKTEVKKSAPATTSEPVAQAELEDLEMEEMVEEIVFEENELDTFSEVKTDDSADVVPEEETQREAEAAPAQTALKKARRSKLTTSGAVARMAREESPLREVKGTVTDDFGDPLPGVNVVIQGTTTGVTTDMAGDFSIQGVGDSSTLVFSSIGMIAQEITVGRRDSLRVRMDSDISALQEVVVTGYGAFDNEPEGYYGTSPVIGYANFKEYLEEELIYPQEAKDKGIEGRVVLKVTISPIGKIDSVEVKRGLGAGCDEEAIRLIKEGPAWKPATRDGLNVEASVRIRVKFELE